MAHNDASATVLLSTHNGAEHLPSLLDSLLEQDYSPLRILVRDDASHDDTGVILATYAKNHPDRFTLLAVGTDTAIGAKAGFASLMQSAWESHPDSAYYLFCDQDDVWHPQKTSALVDAISGCDPALPALAYCDMRVVDDGGSVIAPSFLNYQRLQGQSPLTRLLVQNHVSGCASLFNRAALDLACPLPDEALMHDWWLALLACATGSIHFCERDLVDYRQHARNVVGASGYSAGDLLRRGLRGQGTRLQQLYSQADALLIRLESRNAGPAAEIRAFCQSAGYSFPRRAFRLWRGGYTRRGWLRNLPLLLGAPGR